MHALLICLQTAFIMLKMAGVAVISALRLLNVDGTNIVRLFDVTELKSFWRSPKVVVKPLV